MDMVKMFGNQPEVASSGWRGQSLAEESHMKAEESYMKNSLRCMMLLMVIGLATTPVFAAELRTTGFIDNIFPHYERNISNPASDNDTTRNHDSATWGRTRGRMFFNFIASDDLRGVFGIELDAVWGLPRRDLAG